LLLADVNLWCGLSKRLRFSFFEHVACISSCKLIFNGRTASQTADRHFIIPNIPRDLLRRRRRNSCDKEIEARQKKQVQRVSRLALHARFNVNKSCRKQVGLHSLFVEDGREGQKCQKGGGFLN
jgi:hypothetical protein